MFGGGQAQTSGILRRSHSYYFIHWSMINLCFSKPVIWVRDSQAFASSETSLNVTSFHKLRRDERKIAHWLKGGSAWEPDLSDWKSDPKAATYCMLFTSLNLNFVIYKMVCLSHWSVLKIQQHHACKTLTILMKHILSPPISLVVIQLGNTHWEVHHLQMMFCSWK